ncbi:UNVERIFIED_CONTAM: hypothetical protein Sradi_6648600 [Sesamum radiatum]|uniref:Uncharacterized protein n=1 Tax=Sesamum radiatum TaxID=300843 RepID=A0AAW2JNC8_SESRA
MLRHSSSKATQKATFPQGIMLLTRGHRKLTLKEMQARENSFLDFDVPGIFDDLLEANLIDLPEMKQPKEAERKDDPKYYKYHHLVRHAIQDCFVFKEKVMQLARQGKISLKENFAATNAITIESGHVDGNKGSCNAMHGDNITSNEDTLFEKEDSSYANDCMSTITFTEEDLLLGSKPHNRPLFVAEYINMKQPSKPPLKGFVPSTQEKEGGHEALAINEKGFDPKAFKLLIKAEYNPKEKFSLEKLPPEATGKKLHGLNAIQIMLKENGHAIQDSRVGLGFTPPKPIRIAIKRVNSNYIYEGFLQLKITRGKKI